MSFYRRDLGNYAKGWHRFSVLGMNRRSLPMLPACYCVYVSDTLVYVGQTVDLRNRFIEHNIRFGYSKEIILPWASVHYDSDIFIKAKFCGPYGAWAMRELRLIKRLSPAFNRQHKRAREALAA